MSSSSPIDLTSSPLSGRSPPRGRVSPTRRASPTPMPPPKAMPPPRAMSSPQNMPSLGTTSSSGPMPQPAAMSPPAAMPRLTTMPSPGVVPSPRSMPSPRDMPPANAVSPSKAMPSPSVMPPSSTTTPTNLPPFSQRKVQAARGDLLLQMNDPELDELIKELQNRQRKNRTTGTSNQNCGLLKLPPELLNLVYENVAADAHAKVTTPDVKDAEGKKVRPGLLGTCHQLYTEMFSVFWSSKYIRCEIFRSTGVSLTIEEPKWLYAVVHEIYDCHLYRKNIKTDSSTSALEDFKPTLQFMRPERPQDGSFLWSGFLTSPWPKDLKMWSSVSLVTINPDCSIYHYLSEVNPGRYVQMQGLILRAIEQDQRRVI